MGVRTVIAVIVYLLAITPPCFAVNLVQSGWIDWDNPVNTSTVASDTNEWWWFVSESENQHIGRDGTVKGASIRLANAGEIQAVGFAVVRVVGGLYEYVVVGKSEEITSGFSDGDNSFAFSMPIEEVHMTDTLVVGVKKAVAGAGSLTYHVAAGDFPINDGGTTLKWIDIDSGNYDDINKGTMFYTNGGGGAFGVVSMCPLMDPPKVIMVGDSISEGMPLNRNYRHAASNRSRNGAFALTGYRILGWDVELAGNMKSSNNAMEVLLFDLMEDPDVLPDAHNGLTVWDKNPEYIHVHVGVNDIYDGRTWQQFISNSWGLGAIHAKCQSHGVKMILDAIFPWNGKTDHSTGTYSDNATCDLWGRRLRKWAEDRNVIYIDISETLGQERIVPYDPNESALPSGNLWDFKPEYMKGDGLGVHLNEAGCAAAGAAMAEELEKYTMARMDFNSDYKIDAEDFAIFSRFWLDNQYGKGPITLTNAPTYQVTPTYDGSGQAIHPSVIYFADGCYGYKYWMAMTPYPDTDSQKENPSILASNDGSTWEVPLGLSNPLIPSPSPGYNADPDIVYNDETGELWVYFLRYWSDTSLVKLTLMTSSDGIIWSGPEYLITWNLAVEDNERSYAIVKQGLDWHYWAQSFDPADHIYYRHSTDGRTWSTAQEVTLTPTPAVLPWHLDVIYVPSTKKYLMLFCVYSAGELFFAQSTDMLQWTVYPNTVLAPSSSGWDNRQIYRPTLLYDDNNHFMQVWYSARNTASQWHTGYTGVDY